MYLRLRDASPEDLPSILTIAQSWPTRFVAAGVAEIASDFVSQQTVVADDGVHVRGFAIWTLQGDDAELLWIAVDPNYVRRGIGSALVSEVIAKGQGAERLVTKTATLDSKIPGTLLDGADFKGAHRFFHNLGFSTVRVLKRHWGPMNHVLVLSRPL